MRRRSMSAALVAFVSALALLGTACGRSGSAARPYVVPPQPPDAPVHAAYDAVTPGYLDGTEPFAYGIDWTRPDGVAVQLGASQPDGPAAAAFRSHFTLNSILGRVGTFSGGWLGCAYGKPTVATERDGWFVEVNLAPKDVQAAGTCSLTDADRQTLVDAMSSLRFTDFHGWLAYAEASRPSS
jgi:hypothetical protein